MDGNYISKFSSTFRTNVMCVCVCVGDELSIFVDFFFSFFDLIGSCVCGGCSFHFSSARLVLVMTLCACDLYVPVERKRTNVQKLNVLRARAKKSTEIMFVRVIAVLVI